MKIEMMKSNSSPHIKHKQSNLKLNLTLGPINRMADLNRYLNSCV